jgi:hypothetical protein
MQKRSAEWFRQKDRVPSAADVNESPLATAKLLAASATGMGRPLEAGNPLPKSRISDNEAQRQRDALIDWAWTLSHRMCVVPGES